jgi:hypothetical protein
MGSDYVTLDTGGAIASGFGGRVSPKRTRASTKGEQVMAKYQVEMRFSYEIETDNLEEVMREMEFPSFPLDEDKVEFLGNSNVMEEVSA